MKTRFDFRAHLMNRAVTYLACLIVVPLLSVYAIESKTSPKNYQKFRVFSAAVPEEGKDLCKELVTMFPEDYVVKVESHERTENLFQTYMDTVGTVSDVLLLPKEYLDGVENMPYRVFSESSAFFSDTDYVKYDKHYGLSLEGTPLSAYFSFGEEDYYLLIGENSVHTSGIFGDGKTDQIQRFLSAYL